MDETEGEGMGEMLVVPDSNLEVEIAGTYSSFYYLFYLKEEGSSLETI